MILNKHMKSGPMLLLHWGQPEGFWLTGVAADVPQHAAATDTQISGELDSPRRRPWAVWQRGRGPAGSTDLSGPTAWTWLSTELRAWTASAHTHTHKHNDETKRTHSAHLLRSSYSYLQKLVSSGFIVAALRIYRCRWCEPYTGWSPRWNRLNPGSHSIAAYRSPWCTRRPDLAGRRRGRTEEATGEK